MYNIYILISLVSRVTRFIYLYMILHSNGRMPMLKTLKGKDHRYSVVHLQTGYVRGGMTGSKGHKLLILLTRLILALVKVFSRARRETSPINLGGNLSPKVLLVRFSAQEFLIFQSAKHLEKY